MHAPLQPLATPVQLTLAAHHLRYIKHFNCDSLSLPQMGRPTGCSSQFCCPTDPHLLVISDTSGLPTGRIMQLAPIANAPGRPNDAIKIEAESPKDTPPTTLTSAHLSIVLPLANNPDHVGGQQQFMFLQKVFYSIRPYAFTRRCLRRLIDFPHLPSYSPLCYRLLCLLRSFFYQYVRCFSFFCSNVGDFDCPGLLFIPRGCHLYVFALSEDLFFLLCALF